MTDNQDLAEMGGTKPIKEHEWLQKLIGEWRMESEMIIEAGAEPFRSTGSASVKSLGGLWAYSELSEEMPDGTPATNYFALGYDVSFKEYRGGFIGSMSSHIWNYAGSLNEDETVMTLDCEGPSMIVDGEKAMYRDVITIVDENQRVHTSYSQNDNGEWELFMTVTYHRL